MTLNQSPPECNTESPSDAILLDVDAVARECSVSAQTVRRWVSAGYLHPVALPGNCRRVLVRRSDVADMVDSWSTS
jgi:predicted site-specific integrase-resolvase